MIVLGIHGGVTLGQHEPGAALVIDGKVVAACEEERYLRIKSAYGYLPNYSIKACLADAGISMADVDLVVAPGITYDGQEKRFASYLKHNFGVSPRIELVHHQKAHAAAAFYGSGLDEAIYLTLDATGDGVSGSYGIANRDEGIVEWAQIPTDNSLGFFYTLMTYYLGFADGDEYKVMGLAPYGKPTFDLSKIITPTETGWEFDWSFVRSDPPVRSPFEPMYEQSKLSEVVGMPPRHPSEPVTQAHMDLAHSTQDMMENCFISLVKHLLAQKPECRKLVYAGGIALNCVANGRLIRQGELDDFYVSPVSSDRGLALGCALYGAEQHNDRTWPVWNAYLGSSYSHDATRKELQDNGVSFREVQDPAASASEMLAAGHIVGWHQGRSEAGARSLGNRSILASCSEAGIKDKVNARIKYREEFRPFAPSALSDRSSEYFETDDKDFPFMCFTVPANEKAASTVPAVVHVDGTARLQTVRSSDNELYYDLIRQYSQKSDVPVILNTSFNLKGQPIVETPRDALMTFYGCGLDDLFIGPFHISKSS